MIQRSALVLLLLALTAPASSAYDYRGDPLPLDITFEHHLEVPDSGSTELHFFLKIPQEQLVFQRRGDSYRAEVRVACEAEDRKTGHRESVLLKDRIDRSDFSASREKGVFFEKRYQMLLYPGKWRITTLIYGRGAGRPWSEAYNLEVPDQKAGPFFVQGPNWRGQSAGHGQTPPFLMPDPWRISSDRAHFIGGIDARLELAFDFIFWEKPNEEAEIVVRLEDRDGRELYYARRRFVPGSGRSTLSWELPVQQLTMDAYRLRLDVHAGSEHERLEGRLDVGITEATFRRHWAETLELLRPLTDPKEWIELESAAPEERASEWTRFWEGRDGDGSDARSIGLETYFLRLNEANARFSTNSAPGYLTPRGRIFSELGAPDRMETTQDQNSFRVLQYWYYLRLNRVYVFEDRHGYDAFELIRVTDT